MALPAGFFSRQAFYRYLSRLKLRHLFVSRLIVKAESAKALSHRQIPIRQVSFETEPRVRSLTDCKY